VLRGQRRDAESPRRQSVQWSVGFNKLENNRLAMLCLRCARRMSELFARLRGKAADHTITTVLGTVVSFYLSESPPVAVKEITVLAIKSETMMNDTAIQYVTSHQHEDPNVSGVIAWEKSPWNVQEQQYVVAPSFSNDA
jgi:hypothetical protein